MRNRAKCKLCESIIESFHQYDYVKCKCEEIAIDGGPDTDYMRILYRDIKNFLRIDDEGNEIEIKIQENVKNSHISKEEDVKNPNKSEMLEMLDEMIKSIEGLPQQAMTMPITHYDFLSALLLLSSILRADCKESI